MMHIVMVSFPQSHQMKESPQSLQVLVKKPDNLVDQTKRPGLWSLCLDWTSLPDSSV